MFTQIMVDSSSGLVDQEICKLLGLKKIRAMPYHPKSDGMVNEEDTDWDQHDPMS